MLDVLVPYAVAVGGICGTMAVWLLVQRAWGRVFLTTGDVLAARGGCGSCTRGGRCTRGEECVEIDAAVDETSTETPRHKAG